MRRVNEPRSTESAGRGRSKRRRSLRSLWIAACWCGVAGDAAATPAEAPSGAASVYKARRERLARTLGPGALAVLYGAAQIGDRGAQRPDFFYLTGVDEPGAVLVLAPGQPTSEILFLAPRDPERESWEGRRSPLGLALSARLGFKAILRTTYLGPKLAELSQGATHVAFLGPVVPFDAPAPRELALYAKLRERNPGLGFKSHASLLRAMRMVKDAHELERIRRATETTIEGHLDAWGAVRPGMTEADLKAVLEIGFRKRGSKELSYSSIVAAGVNATVLHRRTDESVIKDGDLVLIDAAASFGDYTTDVTRTFPASGKFTAEQRKLYELVLRAQKAALAAVRPGASVAKDVHAAARKVLVEAGYGDAFLHGTSHHVGLRVHDGGDPLRPLEPGMVLTIEPGVYLPDKGIGIRIEDVVVVTANGYENLSARLPKEPDEIERAMVNARARHAAPVLAPAPAPAPPKGAP